MRQLVALCTALLLAACGSKIELPPAKPLVANAEQRAAIPRLAAGPLAVRAHEPVALVLPHRTLDVRVIEPDAPGPHPLVLFSHGFAAGITAPTPPQIDRY